MSLTLRIRLRRVEGALLRLLGQIGRRGFEVVAMTARLVPDLKAYDVEVEVEPYIPLPPGKPRPPEVLPPLVEKLCDVEKVEVVGPALPKAPAQPSGNGSATERRSPPPASKPAGEMEWEE